MKCRTCGMTLTEGALLCGECGTSALAPAPTLGDTARYDRRALRRSIAAQAAQAGRATGVVPGATAHRHAELPTTVLPTVARTAEHDAPVATPASGPASAPAPASSSDAVDPRVYSLAFSTGDTVRVSGHGLVGRNPTPAEGESFDYLVQIVDPARSMSKTHLEFGVDDDGFWILDRGSANGTRIVEGDEVVDLDPGIRVVIYRGLRVELGDEFFDLH